MLCVGEVGKVLKTEALVAAYRRIRDFRQMPEIRPSRPRDFRRRRRKIPAPDHTAAGNAAGNRKILHLCGFVMVVAFVRGFARLFKIICNSRPEQNVKAATDSSPQPHDKNPLKKVVGPAIGKIEGCAFKRLTMSGYEKGRPNTRHDERLRVLLV